MMITVVLKLRKVFILYVTMVVFLPMKALSRSAKTLKSKKDLLAS